MAKTIREIEAAVRDITQDNKVTLSVSYGLKMFNRIYRALIAKFPWPEQTETAALTSNTVASQESYAWTGASFPTFLDLRTVEMLTPSDAAPTTSSDVFGSSTLTSPTGTSYKVIPVAPSEFEWNLAGRLPAQQTPRYYKRIYDSANKISFRPIPSTSGYAIRVTGISEPTELTTAIGATGTTIFLQSSADDALEHLIAAAWLFKYKNNDQGNLETQRAADILNTIFVKEQITAEDLKDII